MQLTPTKIIIANTEDIGASLARSQLHIRKMLYYDRINITKI